MVASPRPETTADLSPWLGRVVCGDAFSVLPDLPTASAALAIVDGPYNMRKADWDKFPSWDAFREWFRPLWEQVGRVLRDNCSLYVFGTFEGLAALKQDLDGLGDGWEYRAYLTWHKVNALPQKGGDGYRTFAPMTEGILFYARERVDISALAWTQVCGEHEAGPNGVPLSGNTIREYLNSERERCGLSIEDVIQAWQQRTGTLGKMGGHFFWVSQWSCPTRENYHWLRDLFNARGNGSGPYLSRSWEDLRREYEDLRREYEDLRREYEDLRYTFNPQQRVTDVWEVPICAGAERIQLNGETAHVAQKPLEIMRRIIRASSNEGDTVLVPFSGLGSAEVACVELDREFVGIEREPDYCAIAERRIAQARRAYQPALELTP